jgi:MinD superfamily P-loop ATPase
LEAGVYAEGIQIRQGILNIGEPMAVPVIRELKQWQTPAPGDLVIRDAPPGTSCPVVEAMRGSDYIILVTEPTPFGLHDLKLAVELTRILGIRTGVVVNRAGVGGRIVDRFCQQEGIPILMHIPLDERISQALAHGVMLVDAFPEFEPQFRDLYEQIQAQVIPSLQLDAYKVIGS